MLSASLRLSITIARPISRPSPGLIAIPTPMLKPSMRRQRHHRLLAMQKPVCAHECSRGIQRTAAVGHHNAGRQQSAKIVANGRGGRTTKPGWRAREPSGWTLGRSVHTRQIDCGRGAIALRIREIRHGAAADTAVIDIGLQVDALTAAIGQPRRAAHAITALLTLRAAGRATGLAIARASAASILANFR